MHRPKVFTSNLTGNGLWFCQKVGCAEGHPNDDKPYVLMSLQEAVDDAIQHVKDEHASE